MRVEIVPPKHMHPASSFYICRHLIYYSYLISTIPTPLYPVPDSGSTTINSSFQLEYVPIIKGAINHEPYQNQAGGPKKVPRTKRLHHNDSSVSNVAFLGLLGKNNNN